VISFSPTPEEIGGRVDAIVARRTGAARSAVQRALRSGELKVSGQPARPSRRLEQGDVVTGSIPSAEPKAPAGEDIPIAIRYSDARVLVVSKPAGVVTHPDGGHETGTLVNALLGLGEPLAGAGSSRPGIVHRLDKDTSGLVLVAKDDDAHTYLVAALKRREVERRYLALVRGRPAATTGTIDAPVGRHPVRRHRMSVVGGGRPAVTHYRELANSGDLTLLEVSLETGRTHQIRVHLAHFGHPIVGDRTYGGDVDSARALGLERFFLHAGYLGFPHPDDGHRIEVTDPLPADLAGALSAAGIEPPSPSGSLPLK
jgi:23S rRNA pseudouridine1911/1915/1917 synthase